MRQPDRRPILISDLHSGERQAILYTAAELAEALTTNQRERLAEGTTVHTGLLLYIDLLAAFDARNLDAFAAAAEADSAMTDFIAAGQVAK